MSPAATEIQSTASFSPMAKPTSNSQNPNSASDDVTAFPHTDTSRMSFSYSSFSSNAEKFISGSDFAPRSDYHPKSASVRSRPRFVKVRKQLNGKLRNGQSEVGSDFNPFRQSRPDYGQVSDSGNPSVLESSNRGNDHNNYYTNTTKDNCNNVAFVFRGNDRSDREARGYSEVESENEGCSRELENENVGFVFEANLPVGTEKFGSEKCGKFGFVFGATGSDGGVKLNAQKGESGDFGVPLDGHGVKMKANSVPQGRVSGFSSGVTKSYLASNLDSEKGSFGESLKVPDLNGIGFVFASSQSDLKSSDKSISGDLRNMNIGSETESKKMESATVNFNANGSESCNEYCDNGFFVSSAFGSKGSCSNECKDGINSSSKNIGVSDCNSFCKDVSGNSNNICSFSSANTIPILENDIKKLNINSSNNVSVTESTEDSDMKVNSETIFVFSSSKEAFSPLKKEPDNGPTADIEDNSNNVNVNGDNVEMSGFKPFIFGAGIGKTSNFEKSFQGHVKDDVEANGTNAGSSLNLHSKGNSDVYEATSIVGGERNNGSCLTSSPDQSGFPLSDFETTQWDPSSFKANLFPEVERKSEFSVKGGLLKEKRVKKIKGKLKKSCLHKHLTTQQYVPKESNSQENEDSSKCYSPMDFSPFQETKETDQSSEESKQALEEPSPLECKFIPCACDSSTLKMPEAEWPTSMRAGSDSNEGDQKCSKLNEESFGCNLERIYVGDELSKEFVVGAETVSTTFKSDQSCNRSDVPVGQAVFNETLEHKHMTQSCFNSGLEEQRNFTFSALSTSDQGNLSSRKRLVRKKSKVKVGNTSFIITPSTDVKGGYSSVQFSPCGPTPCQQKDKSTYHLKDENEQFQQGSNSSTTAVHETCEMWRLRGNQAYRNHNLSKAEEFYTQGINSVPSNETSCYSKPLLLCYSNRAATRISLGNMREALADCLMAAALDPSFLKVYVRAANVHLLLGETEKAVRYFNECLGSGTDVCLDRRIALDAADGHQKAQRVDELTSHAAMLLEKKSSDAASSALDTITEALSISSYSEKLLEMKAEALCMLRKYEEAIRLCEQSLHVAEKNFAKTETDNPLASIDGSGCYSISKLWRWHIMSKGYFYMGKLEKALDSLQKLEQVGSVNDKFGSKILEMSVSLAVTIRELLRLKNEGNEAVRSGRYTEAIEHYTIALSSNVQSQPFAAICFCNRAAAHQALGQIADAISDCSLAIALNENYTKAISRRATLHEMIRDYGQASSDLQRLISVLEKQSDGISHQSGSQDRTIGNTKELRQAQRRLSSMKEETKRGIPLDLYLLLGVKSSVSTADVKKAYRKAALRHHPDKAGQFLVRSESGDEGRLWKEISQEVHKDADRLFKMIGEAYAVLSDTAKRSEYDLEEEIRKVPKENKSSPYERPADEYSHFYERSSNRRNWRGNSNSYGNSYYRW